MLSNSWNKTQGESISHRLMSKVKPDEPIKKQRVRRMSMSGAAARTGKGKKIV